VINSDLIYNSFASPPPPEGGGFRSGYPKLISQLKGSKTRQ